MKPTVCPYRAGRKVFRAFAVALLAAALLAAANAVASERPKYGGTLRVQISERVTSLDPRQWPSVSEQAAAEQRVDTLIFDRLVQLDERATPQPALAISWQHDAQAKRWQFLLRKGVKFSDGTALTPEITALALRQLLGSAFAVSATSDSVVIQSDHSLPDLLEALATGRTFIFHAAEDGSLAGTGPFRVAQWPSGADSKAVFTANQSCWAGSPFVDQIERRMGVDPQQQANAIAFGQADVVALPASAVRSAAERGVRTASSDPVELFALVFDTNHSAVQDARLRQAVSLAIDRASIADVILQRQGKVAGSLLPNWISGYAHLFPVSLDLPRARQLLTASDRELSRSSPLVLVYDSDDAEGRAVAERVAVNLRDVGIIVQVTGQSAGKQAKPLGVDFRLVRHRLVSPDTGAALSELMNSLGEITADLETPEQTYAAERAAIDAFRVIPLVHVSESYGLSPQVRDWMPPRWGGWRLQDVWLGPASTPGGTSP
jgi:ABC-type transport system substrate-binding protein